jgi:hypothetical protein
MSCSDLLASTPTSLYLLLSLTVLASTSNLPQHILSILEITQQQRTLSQMMHCYDYEVLSHSSPRGKNRMLNAVEKRDILGMGVLDGYGREWERE